MRRSLLILAFLSSRLIAADPPQWSSVDAILENAVASRVFPCVSAAVLNSTTGSILYSHSSGKLVYDDEPTPPNNNGSNPNADFHSTLFDMASLTKILGPTTVAALLYESGDIDLNALIMSPMLLGPAFSNSGKETITVRHLLLHAAGFPPDPSPNFNNISFGCPNSQAPHPSLDFTCSEKILTAIYNQTLENPPGTVYLYSDLSMMTLMFALGRYLTLFRPAWAPASSAGPVCEAALKNNHAAAAPLSVQYLCAFNSFWRINVSAAIGFSPATGFLPLNYASVAPTWNDTDYRNTQLQGVVSDENSYALGGIAGHAGIFASGADAALFLAAWSPSGRFLSPQTITLFTSIANEPPGSPRALGWSTESDSYAGCAPMPAITAYHTGYTGTLLCLGQNYSTLLLAARVYPNKTANVDEIHTARQAFNAAVANVLV